MPPPFVASTAPRRMVLLLLMALGFVAGGVFLVAMGSGWSGRSGVDWIHVVVGWVSALFFGYCGVMIGRRLFDRRPQVIIDHDGLSGSLLGVSVPWQAVTRVWEGRMNGQHFLCVSVDDPARYRPAGLLIRQAVKANRAMGFGDLAISFNGLDRTLGDALAAVAQFAPEPPL